jgi:hypothetical protein
VDHGRELCRPGKLARSPAQLPRTIEHMTSPRSAAPTTATPRRTCGAPNTGTGNQADNAVSTFTSGLCAALVRPVPPRSCPPPHGTASAGPASDLTDNVGAASPTTSLGRRDRCAAGSSTIVEGCGEARADQVRRRLMRMIRHPNRR